MDSNEGLVDGRVASRVGVQVESRVVLKCEGNKNEGAVKHNTTTLSKSALEVLQRTFHNSYRCENDCFVRDTVYPDSMTQVLSQMRKKSRVRTCDVCVG